MGHCSEKGVVLHTLATDYLPAERTDMDALVRAAERLGTSLVPKLFDAMPLGIIIINETRQAVYCNGAFRGLAEEVGNADPVGMRPGEALGCVHAQDGVNGCGTTVFCRHCGAARAILESFRGTTGFHECLLQRSREGFSDALVLQVFTVPFEFEGRQYSLFSGMDVGHEKRALEMERLVFHKLLNSASGLVMLSNLLEDEVGEPLSEYTSHMRSASKALVGQIRNYQIWGAVEQGRIKVIPESMSPARLVGQVVGDCDNIDVGHQCRVLTDCSHAGEISTDPDLVRLVLGVLLENAMEASAQGGSVSLACETLDQGVLFSVTNEGFFTSVQRARMFKRAFSTKGEGRGFGLYRASLVVNRYLNGRIWFEEQDGRVVFYVQLPAKLDASI
jgi:hypothetical protein